jgi:hypothetical protein
MGGACLRLSSETRYSFRLATFAPIWWSARWRCLNCSGSIPTAPPDCTVADADALMVPESTCAESGSRPWSSQPASLPKNLETGPPDCGFFSSYFRHVPINAVHAGVCPGPAPWTAEEDCCKPFCSGNVYCLTTADRLLPSWTHKKQCSGFGLHSCARAERVTHAGPKHALV